MITRPAASSPPVISRRGPIAHVQAAGELRRDHHAERLRERRQSALQRILAAQQLQVQRHHERSPRKLIIDRALTRLHCRKMRLCSRRRSSIGRSTVSSIRTIAIAHTTPEHASGDDRRRASTPPAGLR